jgi:FkbM family methyltransferase
MKLERGALNGIKFYHREGFSDLKTFEEVIGKDVYQKRGNKIEAGEHWMDCGGNVGAFALVAASKGALVTVYEPDPFNCEMIKRNMKLNGFEAEIKDAALVHDDTESVNLFIGNNGNVWRNSIVKKWNKQAIKVKALNFDEEAKGKDCCKMDIEGAEMPILENTDAKFKKLVYEWSFDIDPSLRRLWTLIEKQKEQYRVEASWSSIRWEKRDYEVWQQSWFPACTNVFCFA